MMEFSNMAAFASHLAELTVKVVAADSLILEAVGEHIEKESKAKIGEYQPAAGQFIAWPWLADSTLRDKEKKGFSPPDNPLLRTGEMRDSIGHTVSHDQVDIGSDSDIAVYQELGTKNMPPRSFFGSTGVEQGDKVAEMIGAAYTSVLIGQGVYGGALTIRKP